LEGEKAREGCKHCNRKPKKSFKFVNKIFTTVRHSGSKDEGVRVRIAWRKLPELRHAAISDLRATSAKGLGNCPALFDVAHIDLIEHIIECLHIVHLAIQTA
jgi:hypothetical protein